MFGSGPFPQEVRQELYGGGSEKNVEAGNAAPYPHRTDMPHIDRNNNLEPPNPDKIRFEEKVRLEARELQKHATTRKNIQAKGKNVPKKQLHLRDLPAGPVDSADSPGNELICSFFIFRLYLVVNY